MQYKVTKQYGGRGPETPCKNFTNIKEAQAFVDEAISVEAAMNVHVIYRIYEFGDLLSEHDSTKVKPPLKQDEATGAQGGQGKAASFRPTPLNTTLRPPGMPQNWRDDDEEKGK